MCVTEDWFVEAWGWRLDEIYCMLVFSVLEVRCMGENNKGWAVFACGETILFGEVKDWAV